MASTTCQRQFGVELGTHITNSLIYSAYMAATSYRDAASYEGVLTSLRPNHFNTNIIRSSAATKPTFVKPSFVPDPRIILGNNPRIAYTAVQAEPQLKNSAHCKLSRNTSIGSPRSPAIAHRNYPLRTLHDITPHIPSGLSKVMAASYQEPEAIIPTPPLKLVSSRRARLINFEETRSLITHATVRSKSL